MTKKRINIFFKAIFLIGFIAAKNLYADDVADIKKEIKIIDEKSAKLNILIAENQKFNLEVEDKLSLIANKLKEEQSLENLKSDYNIVADYWRLLADKSFDFLKVRKAVKVFRPNILNNKFEEDSLSLKFQQELLRKFYVFSEKYELFRTKIRNNQLALLSRAGKLRAQILNEILEEDGNFIVKENQSYFSDLYREIRLIPYRPSIFFYDKLVGYQDLLSKGVVGLVEIALQIFWFLVFVILLGFASKIFKKLSESLNRFRSSLIRISIEKKEKNKGLIIFLPKIIPYFSWAVLLIITDILYVFLSQTSLAELAIILPFFSYYFLYRIVKIFINSFLNQNISAISFSADFSNKVELTSQFFGRFFLGSMWILLLTENIVRKALFYQIVLQAAIIGGFIILAYLASLWRDEIIIFSKNYFDEKIINKITTIKSKRFAIIYSLPLLVLSILVKILQKILNILSKNDLIKTLSSQIYRKKLEVAAKKIEKGEDLKNLPANYVSNFNDEVNVDEFLEVKSHPYLEIKKNILSWFDNKIKENSSVIYGKSGMGKTMILKRLHQDLIGKDLKIINYKITEKITQKEQLDKLIKHLFALDDDNLESLEKVEKKTLVLLDDCHNLFLSKRGCLEGFKAFASLVNSSTSDIFWVCTFDNFAWNYLYNALDISKYFRFNFKISRWRDADIKNLILNKHEASGFKMVYDPLIFAIHAESSREEFEDINQKFFQMLWGQSKGNPRLAMMLWLSCLSLLNEETIKINLPKSVNLSQLIYLPDEQFFIYATIAKHHNLSLQDIVFSANVSYASALNAVRIGVEKGYLVQDGENYLLSRVWQNEISQLLINKNFIYE